MEADVKDAKVKYDQALREKDKIDNEWSDAFGTLALSRSK